MYVETCIVNCYEEELLRRALGKLVEFIRIGHGLSVDRKIHKKLYDNITDNCV